jgi:hypothetical protein
MSSEMETRCDYLHIELAALLHQGGMVRNCYTRKDDIAGIGKWRARFENKDVFTSICLYSEPNNESAFICPIFADIDSDDRAGARESCLILCEMIMDRIGVPQDQLEIYFSGNKGFHVVVPCEVFRPFHSPYILSLYKRMAEKAEQAGVRSIDRGVYTKKRIWRLPNSINSKSQLYKIPLFFEELRDMSINRILELAKEPRPEDSFVVYQTCERAVRWYELAIQRVEKHIRRSAARGASTNFKAGWRIPPCVKAIEEAEVPDGIRHQTYLSLARFYGWIRMHPDEAVERIERIDARNQIRDPKSIPRIVSWGNAHCGFPGCEDPALKRYCQTNKCFYARLKALQT